MAQFLSPKSIAMMINSNSTSPPQLPSAGSGNLLTSSSVNADQDMVKDLEDKSVPLQQIKRPYRRNKQTLRQKDRNEFLALYRESRESKGEESTSGSSSSILPSNQQGGRRQAKIKRTPRLRSNLVFPPEVRYDTNQMVNNTHEGRNPVEVQGAPQKPVLPSEVRYDTKQTVKNTHEGQNPVEVQGASQQQVLPSEVKYDTNQMVSNTHEGQNPAKIQGASQQPKLSNEGVSQLKATNHPEARPIKDQGNQKVGISTEMSHQKSPRDNATTNISGPVYDFERWFGEQMKGCNVPPVTIDIPGPPYSPNDSPGYTVPQFPIIPSPATFPTVQMAGVSSDRKRSREQSSSPEADDEGRARKRRHPGSASVPREVPIPTPVMAPTAVMVPQDQNSSGDGEESKGAAPLGFSPKLSADPSNFPTYEEEISVADLMNEDFDQLEAVFGAEAPSAPQETEEGFMALDMPIPDVASVSGTPSMQIQTTTYQESETIQEPAAPRNTFELPKSNNDELEDWFSDFVQEDSYQH